MTELNPEWVRSISHQINDCPYFRLQSMRIDDLSYGRSRLSIQVSEKHLQPFGLVHGGVFSGLIDAAGFWAAYTVLEDGPGMTTVEMKLNYLSPSNDGALIGLGSRIKVGRTLSLAEARVENEAGRLLAHGTVTLMTIHDLTLNHQDDLPPKFRTKK